MKPPFVVQVEAPDPDVAAHVARGVEARLRARGVVASREDPDASVRVEARGAACFGAEMNVAVQGPHGRRRWLLPVPLSPEPEEAVREAVQFLERWGFIHGERRRGAP